MPLSGHSSDLSLADLVQANIHGRNTCRVLVASGDRRGAFYLADGQVVHATFGDLEGSDAFSAMLAAPEAHFQVDSGLVAKRRTISRDWQALMLEAMRLADEGRLPQPRTAVSAELDAIGMRGEGSSVAGSATAPDRQNNTPEQASQKRAISTRAMLGAVATVVLVMAAASAFVLLGKAGKADGPSSTGVPNDAVETVEPTALKGPGDVAPRVVQQIAPRSPDPSLALSPTIVCRVLVNERGEVAEASIFRSRLDLAAFEDAALDAAKKYRFEPGRKNGRPVRVWINLPVSFE